MRNFLKSWMASLLLLRAVAGLSESPPSPAAPASSEWALIFYDSSGVYGWIGGVHARMLANLLGHFQLDYRIVPVECVERDVLHAQLGREIFNLETRPARWDKHLQTTPDAD